MKRRFKQVDVFTTQPFRGNPVAVILDAGGLTDADMQSIARWTNLSETTFVLPPTQSGADYQLRIFTPGAELPFAGHPTVGSAHAVLEAGLVDRARTSLVQECRAGLIPLDVERVGDETRIFAMVPPPRFTPMPEAHVASLREVLGADWVDETPPMVVNIGATWLIVQLATADAVASLAPDLVAMIPLSDALGVGGVTVFGRFPAGSGDAIKVRSFAPAHGITEDPVCGSGNASVGAFLTQHATFADLLPAYTASQGREIGRDGHVHVRAEPGVVRIGGPALTCVDGVLDC